MDKNTITAFILIGLILIIFQVVNQPSAEELEKRKLEAQKTEQAAQQGQDGQVAEGLQGMQNTIPTEVSSAEAKNLFNQGNQGATAAGTTTTLENDLFKVNFNSKGGVIGAVELKKFNTAPREGVPGEPVVLGGDERDRFGYQMLINNQRFSTQDFDFTIHQQTNNSISYRLNSGNGGYIEQVYRLGDEPYSIDYDLNVVGMENQITSNEFELVWESNLRQQEEDIENERYRTSIYYYDDNIDYLAERADDEDELEKKPVKWLSMKQHFFNNTIIAKGEGIKVGEIVSKSPADEADPTVKLLTADMYVPYNRSSNYTFPMEFYVGPNHYNTLKAKGIGLENVVYLGWAIFRWVNVGLIIPIFNFLNKYISNYGIIIALLTILVKTVLFPLTFKSYKSMAKMGALRPELEAIKAKFPDDQQRQQQETMKLYSQTGVNPVGGCLPQLLQFPILVAMFYFFPSSIELRQESFLWAHDLSTYDSILNLPFSIPFYGAHVSLFTLLMAGASLMYTRVNQQMTPSAGGAAGAQMKFIQYFMPFFLVFIFNKFPAGLTFYYFLSNIISFAQQISIKKFFINENELRAELKANKAKPQNKKGGFQERLQKMLQEQQKKQAEMQRRQQKNKGDK